MPLFESERKRVLEYCDAHLPDDATVTAMFDFLQDEKLRTQIESEYYAARYIYKLGEALAVDEDRLHAHVKFQIVQYAGIYEAIVVHLLWSVFQTSPEVTDIQFHSAYRLATALPKTISLSTADTGEEILLCTLTRQKTTPHSIKFDDKVDAAVKIGFLDVEIGQDIKRFYKLRNAIHLESAVKFETRYELADSQLAYLRMQPFVLGVREFLSSGVLPAEARAKPKPALS